MGEVPLVGLEIVVQVGKSNRHEFLQVWELLTGSVARDSNCRERYLYEDVNQDNTFMWVECWDNADQLENHMNSDRFRMVMGAMEVLGEQCTLRTTRWVNVENGI